MSRDNVELVRRAFAAVTIPGDPETMIAASDPGFEMHLVAVGGGPVHYVGADGVREFFRDVARDWESFRFQARDIRDLGERVLVLGDVRAFGRASGSRSRHDGRGSWPSARAGLSACGGFFDQDEALEAAGLRE